MSIEALCAAWEEGLGHRGLCPACGSGRVWHNGVRLRKATLLCDDGVQFVCEIGVRRLCCGQCRARWFHPPERITSRAHYQPCVVARAVLTMGHEPQRSTSEIAQECGCDRRTLGRWVERVATVAEPAAIAKEILQQAETPVLPALPTEVARPTASPHRRARLLCALQVLMLLEALGSLRGIEPPALAHAAELLNRVPENAQRPRNKGDPSLGA